jgi:hypothetical protein
METSAFGNLIYSVEPLDRWGPEITWANVTPGVVRGPHRHPLGLYEHTGCGSGIPLIPETPIVLIDTSRASAPLADIEPGPGTRWYISDRAKRVLERVDAGAFDIRRAQTSIDGRQQGEEGPYYVCDVTRFVDAPDEQRSRITVVRGPMRAVSVFGDQNTFLRSRVGNHRIFRLMYSSHRVACTEEFRAAVSQAGLTGIEFEKMGALAAEGPL